MDDINLIVDKKSVYIQNNEYKEPVELLLRVYCESVYLPIVMSFAHKSALASGLTDKDGLYVKLAAEEVFSYLCKAIKEQTTVDIKCTNGRYFLKLSFLFRGDIPLRMFNLTATISFEQDRDLDEMGLLITSRLVDRFEIIRNPDGSVCLDLIKEKTYPAISEEPLDSLEESVSIHIVSPSSDQLKLFTLRAYKEYKHAFMPDFFYYPGKLIDMVTCGDFHCLLAIDDKNQIVGGIFWHKMSAKLIELFGPFTFSNNMAETIKNELIEACVMAVGKSKASGLFSSQPEIHLSSEYFEEIGELDFYKDSGEKITAPVYFRQINEDSGAVSWCHNELKDFLSSSYDRLFLPRKIEVITEMGETFPKYSVFSTRIDKSQKMATLKVILFGSDAEKNLIEHIKFLKRESFKNIFFTLDTGLSWQSYITPALLANGFIPKVVVPCGGEGDIVIFQLEHK